MSHRVMQVALVLSTLSVIQICTASISNVRAANRARGGSVGYDHSGCDQCNSHRGAKSGCGCQDCGGYRGSKCGRCGASGGIFAAAGSLCGVVSCRSQQGYAPDLFYDFYVDPECGATSRAGMYPVPYLIPAINGRTYYTYQPFLPHEYMYRHKRSYHRRYNYNRGLNRTRVSYSPNRRQSVRQVLHWALEPAR